jgi:hypothetical protein
VSCTPLFRELFKRMSTAPECLTAEPDFSGWGFVARRREQVTVGGEVLDRFEMEIIL